jgi:polyhydroxyalkanoate synthesis regulator phasin
MTRRQPTIKQCIQLVTIIALAAFFVVGHNIPAQALHKEEQALDKFNNLNKFADAAKNGKVNNLIEKKIPLVSLKATDLYKHADTQTKDCIDTAAKRGNGLATQEVVNCAQNPNFYNVNITNSTTATTPSITSTGASPNTGTVGTSTSDTTSTSSPNTDTTSTSSPNTGSFGTSTSSTSDNGKENNLVNDLVKTGKFTEDEAKDFVSKTMQSGDLGGLTSDTTSTSDTQKTANADTNTDTQKTANADTNTDTQKTANADTNTDTQKTANADTNTDTGNTPASDSTQPLNNQDNNQSSNTNSKHAVDYNDLNELVHNIKNHVVNSNNIALSDFQNSGAYKGADVQTQKCIDLAGKIGKNLGDQEIVHCSEDASFFHNLISNNNANNNNANNNNANNNNANNNNANNNNANTNNANTNNANTNNANTNNANTNNANNNNANTNNNANNNNANNNNNNADATSN